MYTAFHGKHADTFFLLIFQSLNLPFFVLYKVSHIAHYPLLSSHAHIAFLSFSGCFITSLVFLVEMDCEHSCTRLSCRHSLWMTLGFPAELSDHSTSRIRSVSLALYMSCSHKARQWGKSSEEMMRWAFISFLLNFRLISSQNDHLLEILHRLDFELHCSAISRLCAKPVHFRRPTASAVRHVWFVWKVLVYFKWNKHLANEPQHNTTTVSGVRPKQAKHS